MIGPFGRARVLVHRFPVDMRKHYDGLWGIATSVMGKDVFGGDVFAFIGKSRRRAKILWWDGTGLCVLCKRLDKGRFVAPWMRPGQGPLEMTGTELSLLLEGCELVGRVPLSAPAWTPHG